MTETAPLAARRASPFAIFAAHPPGLRLLFFTELWERFSYYGMRALLILYLTKYLAFGDAEAYALYAAYTALVYIGPVLGGFLADRVLGPRRSVGFGGILIALGHFTLALSHIGYVFGEPGAVTVSDPSFGTEVIRNPWGLQLFYLALALIIAGEAFFKANISTLVGKLYAPGDARRDAGFTLFYMGINLGAFAATVVCGYLGESQGWHYGFGLAGIGMLIGLVVFFQGLKRLGNIGEAPVTGLLRRRLLGLLPLEIAIYLGGLAVIALAFFLMRMPALTGALLGLVGLGCVIGLAAYAVIALDAKERDRLFVMIGLGFFTILFWALFEQQGSSMNLFADRNLDRHIFGLEIDASQFQSLNPLFILLLAPLFSALWPALERRGRGVSTPAKFALGLALIGAGFAVLVPGALFAGADARVAMSWIVLAYLLQTAGEMALSPIGLSMVTKLSPPGIMGFSMGVWFLGMAAGQFLAGRFAALSAIPVEPDGSFNRAQSLAAYGDLFGLLALIAFALAVLLLMLRGTLRRRMHGAD